MASIFSPDFRSFIIFCVICGQSRSSVDNEECHYDIDVAWTAEVSNSLLASPALVADINADDSIDIITAAFTEEVAALQGSSGQYLSGSWPATVQDSSFHASPLLYDINKDGQAEVMVCTSDGQVMFLDTQGRILQDNSFKVPHTVVTYDMNERDRIITSSTINMFIKPLSPKVSDFKSGQTPDSLYVNVPPHVLATPVIADLNRDGVTEELILPVSYYFDKELYRTDDDLASIGLSLEELGNYLAGSVVVYNLTTQQPLQQINLELTMVSDTYPGYILFTPTVIDLDGDGGPLEIIVGTSAGHLHVLDHNGKSRPGFPLSIATIHGQVTVEDITGDGALEMIVVDTSGNVMCFDSRGKVVWEAEISGSSSPGSRVADINQDGVLDVVIPTNNGFVWALRGDNGTVLYGWPVALSCKLLANVLIARLKPKPNPLDVIVPSYDHHLYVISGNGQCVEVIEVDERSLVPVIAADLLPNTPGLELLLSTSDGTVMCLRTQEEKQDGEEDKGIGPVEDWLAENPTHNRFTYWDGQVGIHVSKDTKEDQLVTGDSFIVRFDIVDDRPQTKGGMQYLVQILAGQILLESGKTFTSPGKYKLTVPTPRKPMRTIVTVQLTNQYGQVFIDSFAVSFNTRLAQDVQWLLLFPLIAMTLLLLLVHGYPEIDLLPLTHVNKHR